MPISSNRPLADLERSHLQLDKSYLQRALEGVIPDSGSISLANAALEQINLELAIRPSLSDSETNLDPSLDLDLPALDTCKDSIVSTPLRTNTEYVHPASTYTNFNQNKGLTKLRDAGEAGLALLNQVWLLGKQSLNHLRDIFEKLAIKLPESANGFFRILGETRSLKISNKLNREFRRRKSEEAEKERSSFDTLYYQNFSDASIMVHDQYVPWGADYRPLKEVAQNRVDFKRLRHSYGSQSEDFLRLSRLSAEVIPTKLANYVFTPEKFLRRIQDLFLSDFSNKVAVSNDYIITMQIFAAKWDSHDLLFNFVTKHLKKSINSVQCEILVKIVETIEFSKVSNPSILQDKLQNMFTQFQKDGWPIFSYNTEQHPGPSQLIKYCTVDNRFNSSRLELCDFHDLVLACERQRLVNPALFWNNFNDQQKISELRHSSWINNSFRWDYPNPRFALEISDNNSFFESFQVYNNRLVVSKIEYLARQLAASSSAFDPSFQLARPSSKRERTSTALISYFCKLSHSLPITTEESPLQISTYRFNVKSADFNYVSSAIAGNRRQQFRYMASAVALSVLTTKQHDSLADILISIYDESNFKNITDEVLLKHFGYGFKIHLHCCRRLYGDFSAFDLLRAIAIEAINNEQDSYLRGASFINRELLGTYDTPWTTYSKTIGLQADRTAGNIQEFLSLRLFGVSDSEIENRIELASNRLAVIPNERLLAGDLGNTARQITGDSGQISGVGRYQPGQSIDLINWRSSARSDQVYVNIFMTQLETERALLVDYDPGDRNGLEKSISRAVAIWKALKGKNLSITIVRSHPILTTNKNLAKHCGLKPVLQIGDFIKAASQLLKHLEDEEIALALKYENKNLLIDTTNLELATSLKPLLAKAKEIILISARASRLKSKIERNFGISTIEV